MQEAQQLLDEKKTIATNANESRLDLEKEVARLREQVLATPRYPYRYPYWSRWTTAARQTVVLGIGLGWIG